MGGAAVANYVSVLERHHSEGGACMACGAFSPQGRIKGGTDTRGFSENYLPSIISIDRSPHHSYPSPLAEGGSREASRRPAIRN